MPPLDPAPGVRHRQAGLASSGNAFHRQAHRAARRREPQSVVDEIAGQLPQLPGIARDIQACWRANEQLDRALLRHAGEHRHGLPHHCDEIGLLAGGNVGIGFGLGQQEKIVGELGEVAGLVEHIPERGAVILWTTVFC